MATKKLGSTKLTDTLLINSVNLASEVTGILPVINGGTGITSLGTGVATALGINIGTVGSLIVNGGVLGTPSSGTLTNVTGLPIDGGTTGTLPVSRGGTGITSGTSGGIPYFSGTSTIASSTALISSRLVVGGGAGTAPKSLTVGDGTYGQPLVSGGPGSEPFYNSIGSEAFSASYNNAFGIVAWGTASVETLDSIEITATVYASPTGGGALTSTNSVVKVIVSDGLSDPSPSATATISSAGSPLGTLLDGSGTATVEFRTSSSGTFRIKVTETAAAVRYLWILQGTNSQVYIKAGAAPKDITFT